jgi:predicted Zn finger-like uncharacterized protein
MQIECPSCTAVYEIPDQLLKRGPRALRCAACGRTWSLSADPVAGATRIEAAVRPRDFSALVSAVAAPPAEVAVPERDMLRFAMPEPARAGAGDVSAPPQPAAPVAAAAEKPAAREDEEFVWQEDKTTPEERASAVMAVLASTSGVRPSMGLLIAWLATLGGLGTLVLAFALWPRGVVAHWPAAARLYEAVGISVGAS